MAGRADYCLNWCRFKDLAVLELLDMNVDAA